MSLNKPTRILFRVYLFYLLTGVTLRCTLIFLFFLLLYTCHRNYSVTFVYEGSLTVSKLLEWCKRYLVQFDDVVKTKSKFTPHKYLISIKVTFKDPQQTLSKRPRIIGTPVTLMLDKFFFVQLNDTLCVFCNKKTEQIK